MKKPSRTAARKTTVGGDVNAARDVVLGDQIVNVDLTRVEALLERIVQALSAPQSAVQIDGDAKHSVIITGDGHEVRLTADDLIALGQLQYAPQATARDRERSYLVRAVIEQYARWERDYLPLAGYLLDAPLRLSDRADQNLSAAGLSLKDLREALTVYGKPRVVLLGEPGAGKTTTLHRLALDLARERLRDPGGHKLPVFVDLFKFTAPDQQPADFLQAEWTFTGLSGSYTEAVNCGDVCFLLDGLNQMPFADRAARIDRWAHWATRGLPLGNWCVFTCRSADYIRDVQLPEVRVQSLDRDRMRQYIELRYEGDAAQAARAWQAFEARWHSGDDRFEQLARNPFMLSLLIDRWREDKPLTASRALLMDDLAERRLKHEFSERHQPDELLADPRGTATALREALSRLAFAMQARGEGTKLTRDLANSVELSERGQLALSLDDVLKLGLSATLLDHVTASDGAAAEPAYTFYHHLLQEYFAARELLRRFRAGQALRRYVHVSWRAWQFWPRRLRPGERVESPPVTGWEETVIMAAGLAGKDAEQFIRAVLAHNLPLAGRCFTETGLERDDLRALIESVRAELLARQRNPRAHLRARIGAGLALGEVGHPELRPQPFDCDGRSVWAIAPPLQDVLAGEFLRGSERGDKLAYTDEFTTERCVMLPAYRIGRYPVTNAEYQFFIEAGGYADDRWWSAAGRQWKRGQSDAHAAAVQDWLDYRSYLQQRNIDQFARQRSWRPQEVRYWKEVTQLSDDAARERAQQIMDRPFDRPAFWDDRDLNSPARPVVGVNWYEADAYCRWLSAISGQAFRLPTETEWEKAARGATGAAYPWGNTFEAKRCNTVESHIYTTTPIGLYAAGVSPNGLFEASGNVWDWTADWYQMYPGGEPSDDFGEKFKVMRGGSWDYLRRYARCAYRLRVVPDNFYYYVGFRVFSPGSSSGF